MFLPVLVHIYCAFMSQQKHWRSMFDFSILSGEGCWILCQLPSSSSSGPQPQVQDCSVPRRTSTASSGWQSERVSEDTPERMSEDTPQRMSEDTPERISEDMRERLSEERQKICQKECQQICQIECQKACQKICQIECQTICQKACQKRCQKV